MNGEGVNALAHKAFQRRIHHAVLLDTRFSAKGLSADFHQKVAFALGVRPAMARVMMGLVDHLKIGRRESA